MQRLNNLDFAGFAGLDADSAHLIIDQYLTKYTFKPQKSSTSADTAKRSLTQAYCTDHLDEGKRIDNLIGKHMYEITNSESMTRQKSCICGCLWLSGLFQSQIFKEVLCVIHGVEGNVHF